MCLLFLFSIATFVGLAPIMVYRSLGVPLPDKLKAYRNVYASLLRSFWADWLLTARRNLQATLDDLPATQPTSSGFGRSRRPSATFSSVAES